MWLVHRGIPGWVDWCQQCNWRVSGLSPSSIGTGRLRKVKKKKKSEHTYLKTLEKINLVSESMYQWLPWDEDGKGLRWGAKGTVWNDGSGGYVGV